MEGKYMTDSPWIKFIRPAFLPTMTKLYILYTHSPVWCITTTKRANQRAATEWLFVQDLISVIRALDHDIPGQQAYLRC